MKLGMKTALGMIALVLATGALNLVTISALVEESMREENGKQELSFARVAANGIANAYYSDDQLTVQQTVDGLSASNENVAYVYIVGDAGEIRFHTFGEAFPADLVYANVLRDGQPSANALVDVDGVGLVDDVGVRVIDGLGDEFHIGFSQMETLRDLEELKWLIVNLIALSVVVGSLLAVFLSAFSTRYLRYLSSVSLHFGEGDWSQRAEVKGRDEIAELAVSLNKMSENVSSALTQLRESEETQRWLLEKAISAQEEERKRISRELHDGTSQSIAALGLGLDTVVALLKKGDERALKMLDELRRCASDILKELHRIEHDLRPSVLDDLGLVPAIRWYLERRLSGTPIRYHFQVEGDVRPLPANIETMVFRIVQESIFNAVKHSRAEDLHVSVRFEHKILYITVRDNGVGFDGAILSNEGKRESLGIIGIRERSELIGGSLEIRSALGSGTEITFSIPIGGDE